jgi:hypothetical protein
MTLIQNHEIEGIDDVVATLSNQKKVPNPQQVLHLIDKRK